jgi:hypothetical protein
MKENIYKNFWNKATAFAKSRRHWVGVRPLSAEKSNETAAKAGIITGVRKSLQNVDAKIVSAVALNPKRRSGTISSHT